MNQSHDLIHQYPDFRIRLSKEKQSVRLEFENAPANAFIEGNITSIRKGHIAAALRDLVWQATHYYNGATRSEMAEKIVGDANLLGPQEVKWQGRLRNLYQVVFQGGHTVGPDDFGYSKDIGEEFGLRGWEGVSGGGPGTMRGTLRGNNKGFHQQKVQARQMGFTAPEIIAAEPPNVYVTDLVILKDIEMRLEAFSRKMHGIVFLPGGVGTLEELLIQLGIKMDVRNKDQILPAVLSAHSSLFPHTVNEFIETVLGEKAVEQYKTIINAPRAVAEYLTGEIPFIDIARDENSDSHEWNRTLVIPEDFRLPFIPTHESMEALELHSNQPIGRLAAELRKLCKGLVHGSVTAPGMKEIAEFGKYHIRGERKILDALDKLLNLFIVQKRMRAEHYEPCYELDSGTSVGVPDMTKIK